MAACALRSRNYGKNWANGREFETCLVLVHRCLKHEGKTRCRFGSILLKSLLGGERNFPEPLMRFVRNDVRDHVVSQKNDHGLSYWRCAASQRRTCPKINICEIFGVFRFSTFSTVSARNRHADAVAAWRRSHYSKMTQTVDLDQRRLGKTSTRCTLACRVW